MNSENLPEETTSNIKISPLNTDPFQLECLKEENCLEKSSNQLKSPREFNISIQELNIAKNIINSNEYSYEEQKESQKGERRNRDIHTCQFHPGLPYTSYCKSCCTLVCEVCVQKEHFYNHECLKFPVMHKLQIDQLVESDLKTKSHIVQLKSICEDLQSNQNKLIGRYEEMQNLVENFHNYFLQVLQEQKEEIYAELELSFGTRMAKLEDMKGLVENNLEELNEAEALIETLLPLPFKLEFIPLKLNVVQRTEELVKFRPMFCDINELILRLNFHSNKQTVRSTIRNVYGQVGVAECGSNKDEKLDKKRSEAMYANEGLHPTIHDHNHPHSGFKVDCLQGRGTSNPTASSLHFWKNDKSLVTVSPTRQEEAPNKASANRIDFQNFDFGARSDFLKHSIHPFPCTTVIEPAFIHDLTRAIISEESSSQEVKRTKMEYHCKFGEFGSEPGMFKEPSGVAVSRHGEILIADANNHRIQAFDMSGAFKRVIGQEMTKLDFEAKSQNESDLVYPNRLAVNRQTGEIYVTERSPTHQVRVYDEEGRFVRRFGSHVLQHPRGITVDKMGRIIVVECKVMRVVIFNSSGSVLNRFLVEKKVNFPNGVAVNDREEIFISDNRRHGIVVFDYHGAFLRTIGGMGITNYPIGVGINSLGELVVADNHNNFNVTIFTQEGKYLRALESRVKHAQCFDTALTGSGSIVLSSKDYRIYVYHYAICSPQ